MIMILFEISQKRAMRDFFMESQRIQDFFEQLKMQNLDSQDFLNLGHILNNSVARKTLPKPIYEKYMKLLEDYEKKEHIGVEKYHLNKLKRKFNIN